MNILKKVALTALISSTFAYSADVIALVNGEEITTEVAPKNFKTLPKKTQEKIIKRLIQKRLASNNALKSTVVQTKEYKKTLEHVLSIGQEKQTTLTDP